MMGGDRGAEYICGDLLKINKGYTGSNMQAIVSDNRKYTDRKEEEQG